MTSRTRWDSTAPPTRSKRDVLHQAIEDYHDEYHTGEYALCDGCTQVHMFFSSPQGERITDKL